MNSILMYLSIIALCVAESCDLMELWHELDHKRKELIEAIGELRTYGKKKAEYERAYKIAYRQEVFRLHEEDKTAWTAAITLAQGDTTNFDVATKRYNRDLASTLYETTQERINGLKLEIRMIESQLSREYGATK